MSKYTKTVERNLNGLEALSSGVCPACDECRSNYGDYRVSEIYSEDSEGHIWWTFKASEDESYGSEEEAEEASKEAFDEDCRNGAIENEAGFSRSPCDACGSSIAGNREVYHYWHNGKLHHDFGLCVDCVQYLANGTEPEDHPLNKSEEEEEEP